MKIDFDEKIFGLQKKINECKKELHESHLASQSELENLLIETKKKVNSNLNNWEKA